MLHDRLLFACLNVMVLCAATGDHAGRPRRGIVLIDEDFDVVPEPGVKQGWSDGDFDDQDEVASKIARGTTVFEGSGSETSSITETEARFVTPGNLQRTRATTSGVDYADVEGSGDDLFTSTKVSVATDTSEGEKATAGDEQTTEGTTGGGSTDTAGDKTTDGTKGDKLTEGTTKDKSTDGTTVDEPTQNTTVDRIQTQVPTSESPDTDHSTHAATTKSPADDLHDPLCLNTTCDLKDLVLLPGVSRTLPEGDNLTLSCATSTNATSLRWYKLNDSDYSLLEESTDEVISVGILFTQLHHSGTYLCLRVSEQSCCHRRLVLAVYEVPSYRRHFLVVGGIAGAALLLLILIGICKSVRAKRCEEAEKLEMKGLEKPFLL